MGREHTDTFDCKRLPSVETVEEFDPANGPCCTVHNFQPDLTATPGTTWNKSVIGVFVEAYMEEGKVACDDPDIVEAYFKRHLQYLIHQFRHSSDLEEIVKARKIKHRREERRRGVSVYVLCAYSLGVPQMTKYSFTAFPPTSRDCSEQQRPTETRVHPAATWA